MGEGTIWRIISIISFIFVIAFMITSCPPIYLKQVFPSLVSINFLSFLYIIVTVITGIVGFYFKNGIAVTISIVCGFTGFLLFSF